jgi:hypothetical protein
MFQSAGSMANVQTIKVRGDSFSTAHLLLSRMSFLRVTMQDKCYELVDLDAAELTLAWLPLFRAVVTGMASLAGRFTQDGRPLVLRVRDVVLLPICMLLVYYISPAANRCSVRPILIFTII